MQNNITYIPESWTHANSYIIHGERDYLIDPSIPFDPEIAKNLNGIIATHFHYDHISQVEKWRKETGLDFSMPETDIPLLTDTEANCSQMFGDPTIYPAADHYYNDLEIIELEEGLKLTIYHTPGHSPGCSCLLVEMKEDADFKPIALISGDTLFSNSIGRMDLKGGSESAMKKSLLRLIDIMRGLPQDLTVLPGHGSPFRIQDAFRMNPYIIQLT